jgi:hypothetical protein
MHVPKPTENKRNHPYGLLTCVRKSWGSPTAQGLGFVDKLSVEYYARLAMASTSSATDDEQDD